MLGILCFCFSLFYYDFYVVHAYYSLLESSGKVFYNLNGFTHYLVKIVGKSLHKLCCTGITIFPLYTLLIIFEHFIRINFLIKIYCFNFCY